MGLPVADDKLEGPASTLTFLGLQLDSLKLEIRLPDRKLAELQELIGQFQGKHFTTQKELESLVGKLAFASRGRHLCDACSNCCQASGRITITYALTRSFSPTSCGGQHSFTPGMESRLWSNTDIGSRTFTFQRMHPASLGVELCGHLAGSSCGGQSPSVAAV